MLDEAGYQLPSLLGGHVGTTLAAAPVTERSALSVEDCSMALEEPSGGTSVRIGRVWLHFTGAPFLPGLGLEEEQLSSWLTLWATTGFGSFTLLAGMEITERTYGSVQGEGSSACR